jgi:type IV pilus assembly protein PilB
MVDDAKTPSGGSPIGRRPGLPAIPSLGSPERRVTGLPISRDAAIEVASQMGLEFVEIDVTEEGAPQTDVLRQVPRDVAEQFNFIPLRKKENGTVVIAVPNPKDPLAMEAEQAVRFRLGRAVEIVVAEQVAITQAIEDNYGFLDAQTAMKQFGTARVSVLGSDLETVDEASLEEAGQKSEIIDFVDGQLLPNAVLRRASDIHFEPEEKGCRVRFRIDGRLQTIVTVPLRMRNAVVSRIKILAQLDITERRAPQDGRIRIRMQDGREVDFRVSILPSMHGEKVVLRVLDQSTNSLTLNDLGFSSEELEVVLAAIRNPWGIVLLTGPTGSGKTTTLAAALAEINDERDNIVTIENPIEIPIPGITQTAVDRSGGLTFANALRAFLRMDPDVIMLGEIRDYETAEIAVKAAATGHLLLSTLHANDAPSTISRLTGMGLEPALLAQMMTLVISQRLVRRVCTKCTKEPDPTSPEALQQLGFELSEIAGVKRILAGETTVEEVLRVTREH